MGGEYRRSLDHIKNAHDGTVLAGVNGDEAASTYHDELKIVVVKWLLERLHKTTETSAGYDSISAIPVSAVRSEIQTEDDEYSGNARPDIHIEERVYEVKTFSEEDAFGGVIKKLQDKIETHIQAQTSTLNFVVDPLSVMLHLPEFAGVATQHARSRDSDMKIRFYTPDQANEVLTPIEKVVNELKMVTMYDV